MLLFQPYFLLGGHTSGTGVEVSRQIGSSTSEASVCLQPLSHDDEAMLLAPVSKRVSFEMQQ